ncbi:putative glycosyl hydrolase [Rosellinia necatrix]|uniref:Putative glycosyl hydrolase n=1 Tax=Rosellinia necatrix TaxID=77044 RepID=A0A1S7UM14_ROSNE|nr:putative glycosyl hydrolase [Rosellinia necatrix]
MARAKKLGAAVSWVPFGCAFLACICMAMGTATATATATATVFSLPDKCPVFFTTQRKECDPIPPAGFLPAEVELASKTEPPQIADNSVFADLLSALNVTQSGFFAPWLGTWPDAISWTAAVIGTHISAVTRSISEDLIFLNSKDNVTDCRRASNLVDNYFTQAIAFYFGQDALAIANEAYDDILWVVLGWLEAIQFVNTHSDLHYALSSPDLSQATPGITDRLFNSCTRIPDQPYHGNIWIPAFSRRARVFWDIASYGWDTKLCDGGMVWNPRLLPYKNAITNELYIAASISMYLYFPGGGDNEKSPFHNRTDRFNPEVPDPHVPSGPRDAKYLKAAVDGYRWLRNANMTNDAGLFVDGFHISGYLDESNNNTRCDSRDESVFSYNQGVILTGQRGLWEATGAASYLADGHRLVQSVIRATGYDLAASRPMDDILAIRAGVLPRWHGLGRLGVMEEHVDASGTASQDVQTFKGIFFHHLAAFCVALEAPAPETGLRVSSRAAFAATREAHASACRAYGGWLGHNVHAAMGTLDAEGRFGQWWTAGLLVGDWMGPWPTLKTDGIHRRPDAAGYNGGGGYGDDEEEYGVPITADDATPREGHAGHGRLLGYGDTRQAPLMAKGRQRQAIVEDPNNRGRGRTVETQSGGLGLLRAYWKIARTP